jgi:tripartite-type tricarboxylate transporter receptor subunit TctC
MRACLVRPGVGLLLVALVAACAPAASPGAAPAPAAGQPAAQPAADRAAAAARAVESFYRGKTIRIIVGSAAGGGYDTYARTVARHLSKHLPGNPTVIVDNMPGAGSLIAANYVYRAAPKDGTVIAHIQGGLFVQQLLGLPGVEFDALKWQILGVISSDNPLCVATRASGIRSLADIINPSPKQFVVGGNAPGSATWDMPMRLKVALDLNLRMVEGYDGTAKVRLAMDQGEVDGMCGWAWESVQATALDRIQSGDYLVIAQLTDQPLKDLPQVPLALQYARMEEARQLIRLGIVIPSKILRPFLLAPEVPAERVQALRQAFLATLDDPEFRQDAERAKVDIAPISGEETEQLIRELFAMPEELKEKLRRINNKEL